MKPVERWVEQVAATLRPDRVAWCDGSEAENARLVEQMLADGTLHRLHPEKAPGSYLHRSHPSDVARTEHLTFIASRTREDAGPTNNWMSPEEARQRVWPLFDGAMKGRTLYVVPYVMGPLGSPFSRVGVEVTDSPYVVANMRIMTRMGRAALDQLGASEDFVPGLHSLGDLSPERRFIVHFPEERSIWSVGSGYGGNALLGKKCFALRIASTMARDQGWMAEHMLILELELPGGEIHYVGAAFPSACGKTNLAMLVSPFEAAGLQGAHGRRRHRLAAARPRRPALGGQPGGRLLRRRARHRARHEPERARHDRARHDLHERGGDARRRALVGGQGQEPARRTSSTGRASPGTAPGKAAHPNSRFTVAARQCPSMSPRWEDPQGVPLSAIVFGGRRARVAPLVFQSRDWEHGVFVGRDDGLGDDRRRHRRRWASCAATRWRCCPSAATTWATTSRTGCAMGRAARAPARDLPRELVPHRRATAASCGRASARTCACCCG